MHQIILHYFTSGGHKVAPHNMVPWGTMVPRGIAWCIILKTLFNIVEERLKKLLNFDVSAV